MPENHFGKYSLDANHSATRIHEVTPDDLTDLGEICRAINVQTSGVVNMIAQNETVAKTVFIAAGIAFPIRARRILQTGTTATGIRALF